jgi:hypothetical protein
MCRKLARTLKFCIVYIPREQNQEANRLANHAVRFRREALNSVASLQTAYAPSLGDEPFCS